ncbi:hypothetical protein AEO54_401 [Vibrio phage vB_VorS-PVo5]|nr:hypothetical protein AEO54_401 [Vibrio phage vB_VorS-PVo5]
MKALRNLRNNYKVETVDQTNDYEGLVIYNRRGDQVKVTIWLKHDTFEVYGEDDILVGKEDIPLDKLEDLLEIIL